MPIILAALVFMLLLSGSTSAAAKKHLTCRDAKTGEYVTVSYAKKYPGLTVCKERK
jgi:hypothetical protein